MKKIAANGFERPLIVSFLTLSLLALSVNAFGQAERGTKKKEIPEAKRDKPQASRDKSQASREKTEPQPKKPKANPCEGPCQERKKIKDLALDLAAEFVDLQISVMAPKNVADVFGRRIAHRYVAFQITISNTSKEYKFLVENITLDLDDIAIDDDLKVPEQYKPNSTDLSLIRGISEKGQAYDPRNFILRIMRGAGTVAAGLIGVTTFGSSYDPGVAVFNGPVVTAFANTFPDNTINQLNRLNDSAYQTNILIPKEGAKVVVAFLDQAMFMGKDLRKKFYDDPMTIVDKIDFRRAIPNLYGIMVTDALDQPPFVTQVVISTSQMEGFLKAPSQVEGQIIGRNLIGAEIELSNPPDGVSIQKKGTPDNNSLLFTIDVKKQVPNETRLRFVLKKQNELVKQDFDISYVTLPPRVSSISLDELLQGDKDRTVTIKGSNFVDGVTKVEIEKQNGDIETKQTVKSNEEIELKITVKDDAKEGVRKLTVTNGTGLNSAVRTITIKKKP